MVKDLQWQLNKLRFYTGRIDGIFGSGTESAVYRFQAARGLPQTGWVDSTTWWTLAAG